MHPSLTTTATRIQLADLAKLKPSARILVFDTETTGLVHWNKPSTDPSQPAICQLGAALFDLDGRQWLTLSSLVQPDGWVVSDEAAAIHGISTTDCKRFGLPWLALYRHWFGILQAADLVVSFNLDFDAALLRIAGPESDDLHGRYAFCAMRAATPLCKLPGKRPDEYKFPRLGEAHRILVGSELENAHDALADVLGTWAVFKALRATALNCDGATQQKGTNAK